MTKLQRWYIKSNGVLIHCDNHEKVEENLKEQVCKSSSVTALETALEQARAENMCDACAGTGKPVSGKPCMCGGSGKMSDAAIYLRETLNKVFKEIELIKGTKRGMEFYKYQTQNLNLVAENIELREKIESVIKFFDILCISTPMTNQDPVAMRWKLHLKNKINSLLSKE